MTAEAAEGVAIGTRGAQPLSRSRGGWRMVVWIVLALVLAGALLIGASHRGGPESPAARAASLDGQLRCPSCDDVSVASSSAVASPRSLRAFSPTTLLSDFAVSFSATPRTIPCFSKA